MNEALINISPSPIEELSVVGLREQGVRLFIKRDELLQPTGDDRFCGNKVRKLKYNLAAARSEGHHTLLTFGGAYSNHIAAVAQAGNYYDFQTIGLIRGEAHDPLNPTLARAVADGMQLHYLDRTTYRQKDQAGFLQHLQQQFGNYYLLPEGGTNELAIRGSAELIPEIEGQMGTLPEFIAVACGTGGTMAGLIRGARDRCRIIGLSALKGDFLAGAIQKLVDHPYLTNWEVWTQYHFGGYAKFPPELSDFVLQFEEQHGIRLDPVYTSKLLFGLLDQIRQGAFPSGSRILAIHTGGLQGWNGRMV